MRPWRPTTRIGRFVQRLVRVSISLLILPTVWIFQTRMHYRNLREENFPDVVAVLLTPVCWWTSTPEIWRKLREHQAEGIAEREQRWVELKTQA